MLHDVMRVVRYNRVLGAQRGVSIIFPASSKSIRGYIIITTLIFLFVITLLVVSAADNIILNNKMQSNMQQYTAVFARAELGLQQTVLAFEGESINLPNSPITLQTSRSIVKIDACGNQTVDFQSIAHNAFSTVVLKCQDIFAKVPTAKNCEKIPPYQVVWWSE